MGAAFRDVHAPRLHGFALLLTVGDRTLASAAASRVMAAGIARAGELRHPERAAAWLRANVLREVRSAQAGAPPGVTERRAALAELGLGEAATDALAQLPLDERAALIAGTVEDLELPDVATVLGRDVGGTRRIWHGARTRYLASATHWLNGASVDAFPSGEILQRVEEAATRAIGTRQNRWPQ